MVLDLLLLLFEKLLTPKGKKMIKEKLAFSKKILEEYPQTRGDRGNGKFLNIVYKTLHGNETPNFTYFNTESWTRARRKVLQMHPELDNRGIETFEAHRTVAEEVIL